MKDIREFVRRLLRLVLIVVVVVVVDVSSSSAIAFLIRSGGSYGSSIPPPLLQTLSPFSTSSINTARVWRIRKTALVKSAIQVSSIAEGDTNRRRGSRREKDSNGQQKGGSSCSSRVSSSESLRTCEPSPAVVLSSDDETNSVMVAHQVEAASRRRSTADTKNFLAAVLAKLQSSHNFVSVLDSSEVDAIASDQKSRRSADQRVDTNDDDDLKRQQQQQQRPKQMLLGVTVGIKDNLCTKHMRTAAGSQMLYNYIPSYDATVVRRLEEHGAIVVGKTAMDEFAMGCLTDTASAFPTPKHPTDSSRSSGGSSGGSAAAVAKGEVCVALGSDTGGSIRLPAAWCGCVGLKPSYGRVSRYGLIAFASSSDTIGPLARSVMDAAAVLQCIAGKDSKDLSTYVDYSLPLRFASRVPELVHKARGAQDKILQGVNIGLLSEGLGHSRIVVDKEVSDAFNNAIDVLTSMGALVREVRLPDLEGLCAWHHIKAMGEASSNLLRYDDFRYGRPVKGNRAAADIHVDAARSTCFGEEVQTRILLGTYVLRSQRKDFSYEAADRQISRLQRRLEELFTSSSVDIIVSPSCPTVAAKTVERCEQHERTHDADSSGLCDSMKNDIFLVPASVAGLPAVSIPISTPNVEAARRLPVGLQLIGNYMDELSLLQVAYALETATASCRAACA